MPIANDLDESPRDDYPPIPEGASLLVGELCTDPGGWYPQSWGYRIDAIVPSPRAGYSGCPPKMRMKVWTSLMTSDPYDHEASREFREACRHYGIAIQKDNHFDFFGPGFMPGWCAVTILGGKKLD